MTEWMIGVDHGSSTPTAELIIEGKQNMKIEDMNKRQLTQEILSMGPSAAADMFLERLNPHTAAGAALDQLAYLETERYPGETDTELRERLKRGPKTKRHPGETHAQFCTRLGKLKPVILAGHTVAGHIEKLQQKSYRQPIFTNDSRIEDQLQLKIKKLEMTNAALRLEIRTLRQERPQTGLADIPNYRPRRVISAQGDEDGDIG